MRWQGSRRSSNIEDRRGMSRRGLAGGGIGMILLTLLVSWIFGINPATLFQAEQVISQILPPKSTPDKNWKPSPKQQEMADFTASVLGLTEDTWNQVFASAGKRYIEPRLVMYTDYVQSGCGGAQKQMGPFYCPADQKVYIDLSFYDELKSKRGAGGDFAQAYVTAHEVGHHVQNLLGISSRVQQARRGQSKQEANAMSVRLELQADCFAGLWGSYNRSLLEQGDIEEAITTAKAIGDDRLQREATGRVMPESFTHGTSEQRARWFMTGFESGDINRCDTFQARSL